MEEIGCSEVYRNFKKNNHKKEQININMCFINVLVLFNY